jgi:hypothetical protein
MSCKDDETIPRIAPILSKMGVGGCFPPLIICCIASSIDMSSMGSAAMASDNSPNSGSIANLEGSKFDEKESHSRK